jgi:hypothetical protein
MSDVADVKLLSMWPEGDVDVDLVYQGVDAQALDAILNATCVLLLAHVDLSGPM